MKILGEDLETKRLATLVATFGIGALVAVVVLKRTELKDVLRKALEQS